MIPAIAMPFTDEVNWQGPDFLIAAFLLFGTGFSIEFFLRMIKNSTTRMILATSALILLIFLWMEMAVGLFGSPLAGS